MISMPARNASASTPIASGQRGAQPRRRVGGHDVGAAVARRPQLLHARAVGAHGRLVPRRHLALGHLVPGRREGGRAARVLAQRVAQQRAVHEAERHAAADRRVRARPRVGEQRHAGQRAVGGQPPAPVEHAAHRQDPGHRLALEPVRVQRARAHDGGPRGLVAEPLQRRVGRRAVERHRPGARVGGQRQDRVRLERGVQRAARRRRAAVRRAEEARVVDEAGVLALLGHLRPAGLAQQRRHPRAAARGVDQRGRRTASRRPPCARPPRAPRRRARASPAARRPPRGAP